MVEQLDIINGGIKMKYRLNFNNINTVAQLIDGDIQSVLENMFNADYDELKEIITNIKELVIEFEKKFLYRK